MYFTAYAIAHKRTTWWLLACLLTCGRLQSQSVQPEDKALLSLKQRAEAGEVTAQFDLGERYDNGNGIAADKSIAVGWYLKAAEQGDVRAQTYLAYDYQNGEGVPQDDSKAALWYRKAAIQGDPSAQNNLGNLYSKGVGVPRDLSQALFWYRKAAEQDDPAGQTNLGVCYEKGNGVPVDLDRARTWLSKAANQGSNYARSELTKLPNVTRADSRALSAKATTSYHGEAASDTQGYANWKEEVSNLTSEVENAEQEALNAEALAEKYSNDSTTAASSGDLGGAILGLTNVAVASKYQRDAQTARRKADSLRAQLDELGAQQPAAPTEVSSYVQQLAQPAAPPDNGIADELHRQQANINATGQQIAAQQAERQRQQEQTQQQSVSGSQNSDGQNTTTQSSDGPLPLSAGIPGTGPCAPGKGGPGPQGAWCGKMVGKYAPATWDCRRNSANDAGCPFVGRH